jgi:hypothetical protein
LAIAMSDAQDNITPHEELKQAIERHLDELHSGVDSLELAEQNWVGGVTVKTDRIADAVLDASKEAGGVVLMVKPLGEVSHDDQIFVPALFQE